MVGSKYTKKELLALISRGEFQRAISKLKQHNVISGLSSKERDEIEINCYIELSRVHFLNGDIQRAIKDVDGVLKTKSDEKILLLKVEYLCYLEHFETSCEISSNLITSKDTAIKKSAIFYHLLASLYLKKEIENRELLKQLSPSKRFYVLGLELLIKDDLEGALLEFKKSSPKAKAEKENLKALIAILEGSKSDELELGVIKPLYRYLLSGDGEGVQNSKAYRKYRDAIDKNFIHSREDSKFEDFLDMKKSVDLSVIEKRAIDKRDLSKMVVNNAALLVNENKALAALDLILRSDLNASDHIESFYVLSVAMDAAEEADSLHKKTEDRVVEFINRYLALHIDSISPHLLNYIYHFVVGFGMPSFIGKNSKKFLDFIHRHNLEAELFFVADFVVYPTGGIHLEKEKFELYIERHFGTYLRQKADDFNSLCSVAGLRVYQNYVDHSFKESDDEATFFALKDIYSAFFNKRESIDKRYKPNILELINYLSSCYLMHNTDKKRAFIEEYIESAKRIVGYFGLDYRGYPLDFKALIYAIEKDGISLNHQNSSFEYLLHKLSHLLDDDREAKTLEKYAVPEKSIDFVVLANEIRSQNLGSTKEILAKHSSFIEESTECPHQGLIFCINLIEEIRKEIKTEDLIHIFEHYNKRRDKQEYELYIKRFIDKEFNRRDSLKLALYKFVNEHYEESTQLWYQQMLYNYILLMKKSKLGDEDTINRVSQKLLRIYKSNPMKSLKAKVASLGIDVESSPKQLKMEF